MFIYHYLFTLVLKSPNGEWPIRYTYIHTYSADASPAGISPVGISTGGKWSVTEANSHINCLELLTVLFAVRLFMSRFLENMLS